MLHIPLNFLLGLALDIGGFVRCHDGQGIGVGGGTASILHVSTLVHVYHSLWHSVGLENSRTTVKYKLVVIGCLVMGNRAAGIPQAGNAPFFKTLNVLQMTRAFIAL